MDDGRGVKRSFTCKTGRVNSAFKGAIVRLKEGYCIGTSGVNQKASVKKISISLDVNLSSLSDPTSPC